MNSRAVWGRKQKTDAIKFLAKYLSSKQMNIKCLFFFMMIKVSLTNIAQQIPIYSSRTEDFSDFR